MRAGVCQGAVFCSASAPSLRPGRLGASSSRGRVPFVGQRVYVISGFPTGKVRPGLASGLLQPGPPRAAAIAADNPPVCPRTSLFLLRGSRRNKRRLYVSETGCLRTARNINKVILFKNMAGWKFHHVLWSLEGGSAARFRHKRAFVLRSEAAECSNSAIPCFPPQVSGSKCHPPRPLSWLGSGSV